MAAASIANQPSRTECPVGQPSGDHDDGPYACSARNPRPWRPPPLMHDGTEQAKVGVRHA